jgi:hypothetical protein
MRDLNPIALKLIDLVMVATLAGFAVHFYHVDNKNENMPGMYCNESEQSVPTRVLPAWI